MDLSVSYPPSVNSETWATKFRRLRTAAKNNNPIECFPLIGSTPWTTSKTWAAGQVVSNNGIVFKTSSGGAGATTGTGPTPTSLTDGSCTWFTVGLQTAPVISAPYTVHNSTYSRSYTISNTSGTTIADGAYPIRITGGYSISSGNANDLIAFNANVSPAAGNITSTYENTYTGETFILEGAIAELAFYNGTNPAAVIIDNRYVDSIIPSGSSNFPTFVTIDFTNTSTIVGGTVVTGRQKHTITIEQTYGNSLHSIAVLPTSKVLYPDVVDNFCVAVVADSQCQGVLLSNRFSAYPVIMKHLCGWPDVMLCGIGGTGFVATNSGVNTNYNGHAITDLQNMNSWRPLGLIIVQPSSNDIGSGSTVTTNATTFFANLRSSFPLVPIYVSGAVTGGAVSLANQQTNETLVQSAVSARIAAGDNLIFQGFSANDPLGPWIDGTGYIGTTNNSGTSDFDINTDGIHMAPSGHDEYAKKNMAAFFSAIANVP